MKVGDFEVVLWLEHGASRNPITGEVMPGVRIDLSQCPRCMALVAQTGVTAHIAWHAELEGRDDHPSADTKMCVMADCGQVATQVVADGGGNDHWLCDECYDIEAGG